MAVRFKLDKNLPRDAEVLLRDAGHDVQTVLEERLGGSADSEILNVSLPRNEFSLLSISIFPISASTHQ